MTNSERGSEAGRNPDKPILKLYVPSLEVPYEGAYTDVYADFLNDPETFLGILQYKMEQENPQLLEVMRAALFTTAHPDYSMKWAALYYEILARSSRRIGLPPMRVTEQLFDTQLKMKVLADRSVFGGINSADEHVIKYEAEVAEARMRDEEFSGEMRLLWGMIDRDVETLTEEGASEVEIFSDLVKIREMQSFIHSQQDEYRLTGMDINGLL